VIVRFLGERRILSLTSLKVALLEVVWANLSRESDLKALFKGEMVVLAGAQTGYA